VYAVAVSGCADAISTVVGYGIVVDAIAVSSHDDAISPVVGYGIVVYARIGGTETALG